MKKKINEIPSFQSEDEEREFWSRHDSSDYINWSNAESVLLPKLKPSSRTIS
jgi:hypothetical protein